MLGALQIFSSYPVNQAMRYRASHYAFLNRLSKSPPPRMYSIGCSRPAQSSSSRPFSGVTIGGIIPSIFYVRPAFIGFLLTYYVQIRRMSAFLMKNRIFKPPFKVCRPDDRVNFTIQNQKFEF
jgi:hypothetical protein